MDVYCTLCPVKISNYDKCTWKMVTFAYMLDFHVKIDLYEGVL